jgi:hypothetical protein
MLTAVVERVGLVVDGVRRIGSTGATLMLVGGRKRVQLQQDYE